MTTVTETLADAALTKDERIKQLQAAQELI